MNIFILFLSMLLFTVQAHALPIGPIIPSGTTLPATCRVGELFIDTDADTNGSLYNCVATDTWKEVDDDGGDGGDIAKVGTPAQYEWGIWTGDGTLKGLSVTASNVVCTDSDGEPVACTNLTDLDFMTSAEFTTAIGSDNDTQSEINAKFDAKMDVTWGTPTAKVCGDANPEGIANGGFYDFSNVGAYTITDFEDADGDHTDYNEGDWFIGKFGDTDITVDFSENGNIEGNADVDFTADADQSVYIIFVYESARWNAVNFTSGYSNPTSLTQSSIELPNTSSGDQALTAEGQVGLKSDEDLFIFHGGSSGEIQGEGAKSLLEHKTWSFDPDAVCDLTTDRIFLMTVGDDAPHGIRIVEWKLSFDVDPTTEFGAGETLLKRATAFIGVGSTATIDDLATTAGVSSEDTAANINGDAAVANGQVIYIDFPTAYTEALHQVIFEMWYYAEED